MGSSERTCPMAYLALAHLPTSKKTASYYVLHIMVASLVAYAVTGNPMMSLALSLLEPSVRAAAFFREKPRERWWRLAAAGVRAPAH